MKKLISTKRLFIYYLHVLALPLFFIGSSAQVFAQGNILITPKRIVFNGSKKSYALNIANTGQDTISYEISLVHNQMKEDGSIKKIVQPDSIQSFADRYLRFYPHSVTLPPNSSQSVRIQVTGTNELYPGEYRSNLYFRALPNEKVFQQKKSEKDSGISMKIIPLIGISMPVFIQVDQSTAQVAFSEMSFNNEKDTIPTLKVTFNRTGNMSVYGDVAVDHVSPQGKTTRVGLAKGVAVYAPNAIRHFSLRLSKITGVNYHTEIG